MYYSGYIYIYITYSICALAPYNFVPFTVHRIISLDVFRVVGDATERAAEAAAESVASMAAVALHPSVE